MNNPVIKLTSYKIENFFGHLDFNQTFEAVAYGASKLTVTEATNALTQGMTLEQVQLVAALLIDYMAELA